MHGEKRPPIEKIKETEVEKRARMRKLERTRLYAELAKEPEKRRKRLLGGTLLLASALIGAWWYFNHNEELDDETRDAQSADEAGNAREKATKPKESKKFNPTVRHEFQERLRRLIEQASEEVANNASGGDAVFRVEADEIDDPGITREQSAYQSWLNKRKNLLEEIGVELAGFLHDDWTTMDETDWQALVDWARDVEERRNILNMSSFSLSPDTPLLSSIDIFSYYGLDSVREAIKEKQFEVAYHQLAWLRTQIVTDQTSMSYIMGETPASDDDLLSGSF